MEHDEMEVVRAICDKIRALEESKASSDIVRGMYLGRIEKITAEMEANEWLREVGKYEAELAEEIKAACIQAQTSAKGESIQVVFSAGRVTWDTKALDRFAEWNPQVCEFRRKGAPSASIRAIAKTEAES